MLKIRLVDLLNVCDRTLNVIVIVLGRKVYEGDVYYAREYYKGSNAVVELIYFNLFQTVVVEVGDGF